ncbi:hypothetical protein ACFLSF_00075 [Candidatus Bipolaricaulota bacterium]
MKIQVTDFARWQLRLTIQDLSRKQDPEAAHLAEGIRELLSNSTRLNDTLRPLDGMAELPHREMVLGSYHLYFREVEDTLWLAGLWPPMYAHQ